MEILRIPKQYQRSLRRMKNENRLFVYDSIMSLVSGVDVFIPDDNAGDLIELIWRDCINIEKKSGKKGLKNIGNVLYKDLAGYPPTDPPTDSKGCPPIKESKVKESKNTTFTIELLKEKKCSNFTKQILSVFYSKGFEINIGPKGNEDKYIKDFRDWLEELFKLTGEDKSFWRLKLGAFNDYYGNEKGQKKCKNVKSAWRNFVTNK